MRLKERESDVRDITRTMQIELTHKPLDIKMHRKKERKGERKKRRERERERKYTCVSHEKHKETEKERLNKRERRERERLFVCLSKKGFVCPLPGAYASL